MANTFEKVAVADEKVQRRKLNRQISISNRELLIAADLGNVTKVSELIESGADCNFKDKDGNTALFYAIESCASEEIKLQVVELLLRKDAIISLENADCETPLDVAYKSMARSIITLIEKQLMENSFGTLVKIIDQNHSYTFNGENLLEKNENSIREKVRQKVEVCLDALVGLVDNKEIKKFTFKNANVFLLFLEAFALQDIEISQIKNNLIDDYFEKEDSKVIKSVRDIFMHRDKQKEIIGLAYLRDIVLPPEYRKDKKVDVSKFFCDLKDYVQWVYNKFCKKQKNYDKKLSHNLSQAIPLANAPAQSDDDDDRKKLPLNEKAELPEKTNKTALLDILHTLVKEAYSVEQNQVKQEQVMFNLIVNIIPLLETDFKDGDLKTLKNLRNELVHNFHKYGSNLNIRLRELMSSLNELSSTLLAYYYAQRVFEVFESIKLGEDSQEIEKKIEVRLTNLLDHKDNEGLVTSLAKAKDALGYKFSETVFPEKDDADIKKLIDQYLKFMIIIDGTNIQKEEGLGEEEKGTNKKSYKLLSDVKRRHIFEKFLMLRTIKDLDHKEYYKGKKEELIQELSEYGIASDTVNSVLEKYVENDKDFENDELKKKVAVIIDTLNSFLAKIPSAQDVISLYRSKDIDKINVDIHTKQEIKGKLEGLPEDQNVCIQINGDDFRVRVSEIAINMFKTFNFAYNKYQHKFTNEDVFNDKIFLNFLASKSIECGMSQVSRGCSFRDEARVFMSIKKLLKIGYAAPYIVRLIVKVGSSDIMEQNDLKKIIEALLKKEGLYADHLKDLLSIEKSSKGINFYQIVCDEVIGKNLTFEKIRSIFKTPKHVEGIVDELTKKANHSESRDKIIELANEVVNLTNSIAGEFCRVGKYDDALKILFDKTKLTNSKLIENEGIHLLCAKHIEARIKNQQGKHEDAYVILESIIKKPADLEDHKKPYHILFLAERAHTQHLLKEYDQAYEEFTDLYKEIRNYVLGLPDDLPDDLALKMDEKEYRDITNSKKYQNLLAFSDEAQYLDIVSIKSRQAFIRSEQKKYQEALQGFKEVYRYRKEFKNRHTVRAMIKIAFNNGKLGWNLHKSNGGFAAKCYHEGLLMNCKAYEMRNEMSFSHTSNINDIKNIILALLNIARLEHHYGKENNDLNYYEKAGGMYQNILTIGKTAFGDHHEYTSKTKINFAFLKNDLGSYYFKFLKLEMNEEAKECHREALKLFNEVYENLRVNQGEEHEGTLFSRKNIAFTHNILGRVTDSVDHYDQALKILDILRIKEWKYKDQCQKQYEEISKRRGKMTWRSNK